MGQSTSLFVFCMAIMAASLAGGLVPVFLRLTHRRLQFGLSFVSGVMLGVALFHMVPHALMARLESHAGSADPHGLLDPLMLALGLGFLAMFFLERFAHFHQHEAPEPACDDPMHGHDGHHHAAAARPVGRLTWTGAAVGMGLHSLLEGVALAASVAAAAGTDGAVTPLLAGLGTFLVILLHKPFDAMTVATLLQAGGGSRASVVAVNLAFALLVPAGIGLFLAGASAVGGVEVAVPYALAFSAGTFLCIAAADLLPEVQFHRHDRVGLSVALVLGVALSLAVGRMEAAGHAHAGPDSGHDAGAHDAHDEHGSHDGHAH